MSGFKDRVMRLVESNNDLPPVYHQSTAWEPWNRVRSRPYRLPVLEHLGPANDSIFQQLVAATLPLRSVRLFLCTDWHPYSKPSDADVPVIRTLGQLGSHIGSFIPLATQCRRCENILSELEAPSNNPIQPFTTGSLRRSASTCEFCFILLQGISKHDCLGLVEEFRATIDANYAHVIVQARVKDRTIRFQSAASLPCPWSQLGPGNDVSVPGSMHCLQRVKRWISMCDSNHQCGVANLRTTWLPTRVIDIGANSNRIQLKESAEIAVPGRYLCLSHCWGTKDALVTTTANIHKHYDQLSWSALPRTYQDTICMARMLAVPYIWIDSLCIVQDDENDWIRESKTMANVYENAFVTIAATSSRDSDGGLFSEQRLRQELISGQRYGADGTPYLIAAVEEVPHPKPTDGMQELLKNWPLLTRGWVLQERLLSPRVIHFAYPEMLWECRELSSCECGRFSGTLKSEYDASSQSESPQLLRRQWWETVQAYSALALSYADDKLPALSGMATRMASKRPGSTYLAGLWSDSLAMDLLWLNADAIGPNRTLTSRPDAWRAPTWSWASLDAPVEFPFKDSSAVEMHFKIIGVNCKPATDDETGRVKQGYLKLQGLTARGKLTATGTREHGIDVTLEVGEITCPTKMQSGNRLYLDNAAEPLGAGPRDPPFTADVLCLSLATATGPHTKTQLTWVLCWRPEQDLYERVGIAYQWQEVTRANRHEAYGFSMERGWIGDITRSLIYLEVK
ncbi:heterokaryon incompatibility protein-domain-containing protein [Podospora appendiculata]|uniref:Heterokaryon incompatibility protein-domain-containing protein n=1 Tax=Podospora appendiculata TaxID=314037 RepID=A0AAE0X477_9PEZI|nr:heterokaryon incompatibility protein-domain-containing protein [Podospora appendiculata]